MATSRVIAALAIIPKDLRNSSHYSRDTLLSFVAIDDPSIRAALEVATWRKHFCTREVVDTGRP